MFRSAWSWSLAVLLIAGLARAGQQPPEVVALLPTGELPGGLSVAGAPEHFVGKKLFDYMNGGAELFLAFGFEDLGVAEYQRGELGLRVAIYKMGGPAEAYGIYAFSARGPKAALVGPSSLAPNMLSFCKGRFYVRVLAHQASAGSAEAMTGLAKLIFDQLPGQPEVPASVARLPEGALDGTLRYLSHPQTARTVWFDGEGDLLLSPGARAVVASYAGGDEDLVLTLAEYPDAQAALAACRALTTKLGLQATAATDGCAASGKTPDDVFAALAVEGPMLRWACGAPDVATAQTWMKKIR
jgi:hypothetical protein